MADQPEADLTMDPASLYREDVFTDRKLGTIRRLVPVTADGQPDESRTALFIGQAQIVTPGGLLPLSFEIEANSLPEAVAQFGAAAKVAIEDTVRELQELRRQAASSLVIPDTGATAQILGPSGMPAGAPGKIRLR
ncbi:MAG TPA: hypothetical protein VNO26_06390 [Candidatus Limnocylindria bacterium]|nr:hypothetical protein [Candidatus Limnocylindria bacterium]